MVSIIKQRQIEILEDAVVQSTHTVKKESAMTLKVAHSPDADDKFMFWPLRSGLVSSEGLSFQFVEADTQTLNHHASKEEFDICAVSALHLSNILESYQPLVMGASVGDNYGPVVLGNTQITFTKGTNLQTLLTPGLQTTAHGVLKLLGYEFQSYESVPIVPMQRVFDRLREHPNACALVIHEGRLTYASQGFIKLLDLGIEWKQKTGGSLPLGINVIRKNFNPQLKQLISHVLVQSCCYALAHKEDYLKLACDKELPWYSPLSRAQLSEYLSLYANETTAFINETDKKSLETLISLQAGKAQAALEWV